MNDKNVNQEIQSYKKINNRNNIIIIGLSAVLVFVFFLMIYVRFFG